MNDILDQVTAYCEIFNVRINNVVSEASDPEKVSVLPGTVSNGHFVFLETDQHVYLGQG